jgi:hypothetical protein
MGLRTLQALTESACAGVGAFCNPAGSALRPTTTSIFTCAVKNLKNHRNTFHRLEVADFALQSAHINAVHPAFTEDTAMIELSPEDLAAARENPTSLHFKGLIRIPFDHAAYEAYKERGRAFEREQYAKSPKLRADAVARATKSRNRRKAATAEANLQQGAL